MKIEIGKKYFNRLGNEVHITSESGIPNHPFKDADGNYYTEDGYYIDSGFDTERDLVTLLLLENDKTTSIVKGGGSYNAIVVNLTSSPVSVEILGNDLNITSSDLLPKVSGMGVAIESPPDPKPTETPSSEWHKNGEPDPHGKRFDCERSQLEMGHLTDDEFANAFYLYNHRTGLQSEIWLDAAKNRIRWLSRALEKAIAKKSEPSKSEELLLAEVQRLKGTLKCIATQAKTKHPNTLRIIEINATQALRNK